MSNKRIKDLPTMSSVASKEDYLIIDPTSGATSKISLEQAVLNTEFAKAGGAAGAPFTKVALGTAVAVTNIFASSSVATGTIHWAGADATLIFSKNKDSSTMNCVFTGHKSAGGGKNPAYGQAAFDLPIQGGDPKGGKQLRNLSRGANAIARTLIYGRGMYIMFANNGIGYWSGGSPWPPACTQVSYWIVES